MRDPHELRERAGIRGDPSSDQHFLEDDRVLDRIITYAHDAEFPFEHILEIGPGTGALTAYLLAHADQVTAVERDRDLADFLQLEFREEIADHQLTVVHGDALEVSLPPYTACISNLPYGISSEIIFRLLPHGVPLLVMVQREFGERMAATPGTSDYGRLSVTTQHYGAVTVHEIVPPSAFAPPPAVESAIVEVHPVEPAYTLRDTERFFGVVRGLFTQRRKTIRNGIRNTVHISGIESPAAVLDQLPEDLLAKRPDAIDSAAFAHIANVSIACEER